MGYALGGSAGKLSEAPTVGSTARFLWSGDVWCHLSDPGSLPGASPRLSQEGLLNAEGCPLPAPLQVPWRPPGPGRGWPPVRSQSLLWLQRPCRPLTLTSSPLVALPSMARPRQARPPEPGPAHSRTCGCPCYRNHKEGVASTPTPVASGTTPACFANVAGLRAPPQAPRWERAGLGAGALRSQ